MRRCLFSCTEDVNGRTPHMLVRVCPLQSELSAADTLRIVLIFPLRLSHMYNFNSCNKNWMIWNSPHKGVVYWDLLLSEILQVNVYGDFGPKALHMDLEDQVCQKHRSVYMVTSLWHVECQRYVDYKHCAPEDADLFVICVKTREKRWCICSSYVIWKFVRWWCWQDFNSEEKAS